VKPNHPKVNEVMCGCQISALLLKAIGRTEYITLKWLPAYFNNGRYWCRSSAKSWKLFFSYFI